MEKVIVIGATSMIGRALIDECIKNNTKVVAIVRKYSNKINLLPSNNLIEVVTADLSELNCVNMIKSCDVAYCFAWDGTSKEARLDAKLQFQNIKYTLDAVELAKRCGCKMFIGAGSQAEYGICTERIYPETKVNPLTSYGISKYAAGKLSANLCESLNMKCVWTRIFSVYGENDSENTMIKYAIRQFREGIPAEFSSSTQLWNYLYESDAGKIFYLLGEKDVKPGVYNVASADTRPLKEFILELKDIYNKDAQCGFAAEINVPKVSLDPDISSLVEAIGWKPDTSFSIGINNVLKKC
ncbi:MAG: NAD-dependent epimerase/dehydratase family protein [Candidatus Coproplasma sp.]